MTIIYWLMAIILAGLAYVRFAPVSPDAAPDVEGAHVDRQSTGGFTAVRPLTEDAAIVKERLIQIALATPRTKQLSSDPLRFVTRSLIFGFPDVTDVRIENGMLYIHAHLLFGRSDMGVNKARVLDWLARLGPL